MPQQKNNVENKEDIKVPPKLSVFEDKKTKAKTVAFPFVFPDGVNGVLTITRIVKTSWNPYDDLKNVVVVFNTDEPVKN